MSLTNRVFLPLVRFERTIASLAHPIEFFVFGNEVTCGLLIPIEPLRTTNTFLSRNDLCELLDAVFIDEFAEIIETYLVYLAEIGYIRYNDGDYLGHVEYEDGTVRCELLHLSGVASGNPGSITLNGEYYFIASADTTLPDFLPLVNITGVSDGV